MTSSDRPRSPFAGMADLSAQRPIRVLSPGEIEQMLALHRLYLETEYHEGHRANFSSADQLSSRSKAGAAERPPIEVRSTLRWGNRIRTFGTAEDAGVLAGLRV
jgi:hypothetical protein